MITLLGLAPIIRQHTKHPKTLTELPGRVLELLGRQVLPEGRRVEQLVADLLKIHRRPVPA